jgi:hypothetical protein
LNPPLENKRWWTIAQKRSGESSTTALAAFCAVDAALARMYAELLWPPVRGVELLVMPADAVDNSLRNRARLMFMLDCDLSHHQAEFVSTLRHADNGVCLLCGCTNDCACPGGCWWVTSRLCSACCRRAGIVPEVRASIELAANPGGPDLFPPELTFPACPEAAVLIRRACFAMHAGSTTHCHELLKEATRLIGAQLIEPAKDVAP